MSTSFRYNKRKCVLSISPPFFPLSFSCIHLSVCLSSPYITMHLHCLMTLCSMLCNTPVHFWTQDYFKFKSISFMVKFVKCYIAQALWDSQRMFIHQKPFKSLQPSVCCSFCELFPTPPSDPPASWLGLSVTFPGFKAIVIPPRAAYCRETRWRRVEQECCVQWHAGFSFQVEVAAVWSTSLQAGLNSGSNSWELQTTVRTCPWPSFRMVFICAS